MIDDLCLVPDHDQCLVADLSDNLVLPDHVDDPSLCPGQTRQAGLDNLENKICFMSDASSKAWQNSDSSKCFVRPFVVDIVHTLQTNRWSNKSLVEIQFSFSNVFFLRQLYKNYQYINLNIIKVRTVEI